MKKILPLISLALIAFVAINFTGCSKDDSSAAKKLVVVKRANGKLFTVDKKTGSLTEIGHITLDGDSLRGLRCLVFDPSTNKAYAGSTNSDNGRLYSIDLKTGAATLLNNNTDDNWDAISGLLVNGDSLISHMYSNIVYNSAVTRFSKSSGIDGKHWEVVDDMNNEVSGYGGLMYGENTSKIVLGGINEIYLANSKGLVSDTIEIVPTTNISLDYDNYIQALTKHDGNVYSLIWDYDNNIEYLVMLNTKTGVITEISELASGSMSKAYHCLASIPESELP